MQQEVLEPNEILVNYIYHKEAHKCDPNYLSKLNVFIFRLTPNIFVYALTRGKNRKLEFSENKYTKQIQRKIQKQCKQFDEPEVIVQEETEQIFIHCPKSQKICTIQQEEKKFQSYILNYQCSQKLEFEAFEKYLLGRHKNQIQLFRKNNLKQVLRQIANQFIEYIPEKFHLLQIKRRDEDYLLYRRSFFSLKIIRKVKNEKMKQILAFNGRYFTTYHNQSGKTNVIDSVNMRIQQSYHFQQFFDCHPIRQLGLFFLTSDQMENKKKQNSIKLEQNTLVQIIRSKNYIWHIKYSGSLGLLIFYNECDLNNLFD